MQMRSLVRAATAAVVLGLVAPRVARAQSIWDLVTLSGTTGYLGTSSSFTNGAFGTVTAYSTNDDYSIFAKNGGGVLGTEWGLGLCRQNGDNDACSTRKSQHDHEIGDWQNVGIILDLGGLASNVHLLGFTLASAQANESWKVSYQTTATCDGSTGGWGSSYTGNTPNRGSDYFDQATTGYNCLFFQPVWAQESYQACKAYQQVQVWVSHDHKDSNHHWVGAWRWEDGDQCTEWETKYKDPTSDGNYLLQSITTDVAAGPTETTVPEPASMTLLATGLVGMMAAARRRRNKK